MSEKLNYIKLSDDILTPEDKADPTFWTWVSAYYPPEKEAYEPVPDDFYKKVFEQGIKPIFRRDALSGDHWAFVNIYNDDGTPKYVCYINDKESISALSVTFNFADDANEKFFIATAIRDKYIAPPLSNETMIATESYVNKAEWFIHKLSSDSDFKEKVKSILNS